MHDNCCHAHPPMDSKIITEIIISITYMYSIVVCSVQKSDATQTAPELKS